MTARDVDLSGGAVTPAYTVVRRAPALPGSRFPLGATVVEGGTNFAVAAGDAYGMLLCGALGAWFARRSASDAFAALDGAGVPVEIADSDVRRTWFGQPDLVAAGLVADYQHPQYGRFRQFGHLIDFSDTPGHIGGPPPLLGQHSREILQRLGYSADEIDDLRARGVTTWPD